MERIQLTGFCVQEFIISGLYILETVKMLRLDAATGDHPKRNKKIMYQLVGINLLIITIDIVLLVVEYLNFFVIQTTLKPMVYSIKLKLEFAVLGRLVVFVRSHHRPALQGPDQQDFSDFVDVSRITSDYTHALPSAGHVSQHPWG
jgi:Na+-translocating ferredoxin:NAD+ oxidoreductase RnfA subunit